MVEPFTVAWGVAIAKLWARELALNDTADAFEDGYSVFKNAKAVLSRNPDPLGVAIGRQLDQKLPGVREPAKRDQMAIAVANVADLFSRWSDADTTAAVRDPDGFPQYLQRGPGAALLSTTEEALTPLTRDVMDAAAQEFVKLAPRSAGFVPGALTQLLAEADEGLQVSAATQESVARIEPAVHETHAGVQEMLPLVRQIHARPPATGPVVWPVRDPRQERTSNPLPRPELQEQIQGALAGHGTAVLTQVVRGDGGVGKSHLATLVYDASKQDCDLCLWITASRSAIETAYGAAATGRRAIEAWRSHRLCLCRRCVHSSRNWSRT